MAQSQVIELLARRSDVPRSGPSAACSPTHARFFTAAAALVVAIFWTGVTFASIGTPTGVCGAFHPGGCCGDPAKAAAYVANQCVGKSTCVLNADINTFNGGADPCHGIAKHVNVQVACSIAAPPAPPPAGPPVPTWTPNWNLTESTVIQPGGCDLTSPACKNGKDSFELNHSWGLVSLDWSVGDRTWTAHSSPAQNNQTATSKAICKTLKQSGKAQRCFICEHLRSESVECHACSFSLSACARAIETLADVLQTALESLSLTGRGATCFDVRRRSQHGGGA